jgi:hypothetical protein
MGIMGVFVFFDNRAYSIVADGGTNGHQQEQYPERDA